MPEKRNDIGALWENTTRDGRVILKGTINGEKVVGFRNEYKKEDRHPDWKFYRHAKRRPAAVPAENRSDAKRDAAAGLHNGHQRHKISRR